MQGAAGGFPDDCGVGRVDVFFGGGGCSLRGCWMRDDDTDERR